MSLNILSFLPRAASALLQVLSYFFLALCFLLLSFIGLVAYHNPLPQASDMVCCAYNENLKWIHSAARHYDRIYLYIKNTERFDEVAAEFQESNIEVIPFENKGSCDHIYLHHIITHYHDLNDRIAFMKGSELKVNVYCYYFYIPLGLKVLPICASWHEPQVWRYFSLSDWQFRNNPDAKYPFQKSSYSDFNDYLHSLFSPQDVDLLFAHSSRLIFEGNFIVGRNNIHRYPRALYEQIIDNSTPGPNREIDHFHERLWGLLFSNNMIMPLKSYSHKDSSSTRATVLTPLKTQL